MLERQINADSAGVYPRRLHFDGAGAQQFINEAQVLEGFDRSRRQEAAADFRAWKAVALQGNRVDSVSRQLALWSPPCPARRDCSNTSFGCM